MRLGYCDKCMIKECAKKGRELELTCDNYVPPIIKTDLEPDLSITKEGDHYRAGNIEAIEYIEQCGALEGFCIGNALKYIGRANHKGTKEDDLFKAENYLHYLRTGEWIKK